MYDTELFIQSKETLEETHGLRQVFQALPERTEWSLLLDDRIPCTLTYRDQKLLVLPEPARQADFEIVLFSESIRRLKQDPPADVMTLLKVVGQLSLAGHVRARMLTSLMSLKEKGYPEAVRRMGLELQKDLSQYAFILLGQAQRFTDTIKNFLKR